MNRFFRFLYKKTAVYIDYEIRWLCFEIKNGNRRKLPLPLIFYLIINKGFP